MAARPIVRAKVVREKKEPEKSISYLRVVSIGSAYMEIGLPPGKISLPIVDCNAYAVLGTGLLYFMIPQGRQVEHIARFQRDSVRSAQR